MRQFTLWWHIKLRRLSDNSDNTHNLSRVGIRRAIVSNCICIIPERMQFVSIHIERLRSSCILLLRVSRLPRCGTCGIFKRTAKLSVSGVYNSCTIPWSGPCWLECREEPWPRLLAERCVPTFFPLRVFDVDPSTTVTLWNPCFFDFLTSLLVREATSRGSSRVLNCVQVSALKVRSASPNDVVTLSSSLRVSSVWRRSLASPCQYARRKRSLSIRLLCGSSSRPSKIGIAH